MFEQNLVNLAREVASRMFELNWLRSRCFCSLPTCRVLSSLDARTWKKNNSFPQEHELIGLGYNFRSLQHITPYLEPTTAGITSLWARTTALKHNCVVMAGYPEKVDVSHKWPSGPEYYNSAIVVNADGETIANYRKSFLYYTDETWALEGPDRFYSGLIEGLGNVALGICKWPTKSFEREYPALELLHER